MPSLKSGITWEQKNLVISCPLILLTGSRISHRSAPRYVDNACQSEYETGGHRVSDMSLSEELERKEDNAEQIAEVVIRDERLIGSILEGVSSTNAGVRAKCIRTLKIVSEKNPLVLFTYVEFFDKLLSSTDAIIKQNAMDVMENLIIVDDEEFCRKSW